MRSSLLSFRPLLESISGMPDLVILEDPVCLSVLVLVWPYTLAASSICFNNSCFILWCLKDVITLLAKIK